MADQHAELVRGIRPSMDPVQTPRCACTYPEAKGPCPSQATGSDGLCGHCRALHNDGEDEP